MAKVAVVGAGFSGLAAAWRLRQLGHQVVVFEKESYPGGLAAGFKADGWDWTLEHHYHHVFLSDRAIKNFAKELELERELFFRRPKTSVYYQNQVFQLDSPTSLLKAPVLDGVTKLKVAATLAGLKLTPEFGWRYLERLTAKEFLLKTMGAKAWQVLWQPLFEDKFGEYATQINAAWFWARIKARTPSLGYFKGGFLNFAFLVMRRLKKEGVRFYLDTSIKSLIRQNQQWLVKTAKSKRDGLMKFDIVLLTLPADQVARLVKTPKTKKLPWQKKLDYLSAVTLVIESDKPFFKDRTYWLNVNDLKFPFLAVVEHTHFISKKYYGNKHIIYVGKYLRSSDQLYKLSAKKLLAWYQPWLKKLSPGFDRSIRSIWRFQAPFAQPVVGTHHSRLLPSIKTPLPGLYWASMQHVYPWDRGTNFAVKLGLEAAETVNLKLKIKN